MKKKIFLNFGFSNVIKIKTKCELVYVFLIKNKILIGIESFKKFYLKF